MTISRPFALGVYDAIVAAGEPFGLRLAGYHALNSLRIEKAYRHWGHDITEEDTPLEAGLGFAVAWRKPGGFIGHDALLRQKETGPKRRLVTFGDAASEDDPAFQPELAYDQLRVGVEGVIVGPLAAGHRKLMAVPQRARQHGVRADQPV